MDPEIYKQLGELQGRFNTFEQNMAREFADIKQTIKEQSVVPYGVYEARTKATDTIHANHEERLKGLEGKVDGIEDNLQIREHTVTGKIAAFLDSAIVKVVGTGVVSLVLLAVYWNYQSQIEQLTKKVNEVEQVKEIRKETIIQDTTTP